MAHGGGIMREDLRLKGWIEDCDGMIAGALGVVTEGE